MLFGTQSVEKVRFSMFYWLSFKSLENQQFSLITVVWGNVIFI